MSLVLGGRPDQALVQVARGLARARELGHPYTLALALSTSVLAAHFREDYESAIALADECLRVTRGRGFVQNDAIAIAFRGWARVMLGDAAGAAQHEEGLALLHDSSFTSRPRRSRCIAAGSTKRGSTSAASRHGWSGWGKGRSPPTCRCCAVSC
jgi:hypothetical protein